MWFVRRKRGFQGECQCEAPISETLTLLRLQFPNRSRHSAPVHSLATRNHNAVLAWYGVLACYWPCGWYEPAHDSTQESWLPVLP